MFKKSMIASENIFIYLNTVRFIAIVTLNGENCYWFFLIAVFINLLFLYLLSMTIIIIKRLLFFKPKVDYNAIDKLFPKYLVMYAALTVLFH